ncbi:hypothetical protein AAL_02376 [Moelleriella libera RCEF 2490]|uniref:Uncharacterized protein n=1 Tax=Moelleriella libera RCEF 2490 TaxID=1081109 RepID=A0A168EI79_9HYPO|nr:hypothetical protein AAL_02376 [Moelleriella libera RCEF 2490]
MASLSQCVLAANNNHNDNDNITRAPLLARQAAATPTPGGTGPKSGNDCFTSTLSPTTACVLETANGRVQTQTCTPATVTSRDCLPGWMCSLNNQNQDVCMKAQNGLDTGGIIIAIVFGSFIVLGVGYLTFACCREKRQHKRMAAKAEAVALARAQTKKHKAQEQRAPLMSQQSSQQGGGGGGGYGGAGNPFQES